MLYIFNKNDGVHIAWNGVAETNVREKSLTSGLIATAAALIRTRSAG